MNERMLNGPVVCGTDGSEAARHAAGFASKLAAAMDAPLHHVHAVRDSWSAVREVAANAIAAASATPSPGDPLPTALSEKRKIELAEKMRERLGPDALVFVDEGRPASVLANHAEHCGASLIVVGGKHHHPLGRWVVSSTAADLIRTANTPVFVTRDAEASISRILVAVDLSPRAPDVLRVGERFAALAEAAFLALHVVDTGSEDALKMAGLDPEKFVEASRALADSRLWSTLTLANATHEIRTGSPGETIRRVAKEFDADVTVLGSHGHGWDGRMLLGGTTEGLVADLPTSVLIVPVD